MKEQAKIKNGGDGAKNTSKDDTGRQKADYKAKEAVKKQNTKASDRYIESQKEKYEAKIHAIENNIKSIDTEMEECATDYVKLNRLYQQKETLSRELDALMEKWLSLN